MGEIPDTPRFLLLPGGIPSEWRETLKHLYCRKKLRMNRALFVLKVEHALEKGESVPDWIRMLAEELEPLVAEDFGSTPDPAKNSEGAEFFKNG